LDAHNYARNVEINEQPNAFIHQLQIRQHLCIVNGQYNFDSLQLDDNCILHQQIDAIGTGQHQVFVTDWRSEEHTSELQSPCNLDTLSLHDALPICLTPITTRGTLKLMSSPTRLFINFRYDSTCA